MLSADEVQTSLAGAWQLMMGKADGLRLLDLSADGFWNSFFALVVAAPALVVGWVGVANEIGDPDLVSGRVGTMLKVALVDVGTWVLPLAVLAAVARHVGIGPRFVAYVVASNWASALIAWVLLPAALARLLLPPGSEVATLLSLAFFLLTMVLTWRMTNAVIGKGPAVGSAVFGGMLAVSLLVLFALQALLGLDIPG